MKKIILTILVLSMLVLPACGNTSAPPVKAGDTIGSKYMAAFANSSAKDAESAVKELISLGIIETELVEMPVSEGYLDGFSTSISGFSKGVKFSPMIGSIPFVGYVFESDSPETLLQMLEKNADLAWNICTRADEIATHIRGNLVFVIMCSNDK